MTLYIKRVRPLAFNDTQILSRDLSLSGIEISMNGKIPLDGSARTPLLQPSSIHLFLRQDGVLQVHLQ